MWLFFMGSIDIMLQQLRFSGTIIMIAAGIVASAKPGDERTCEDPIPNTHILRELNEENIITAFGSVVRD